MGDREKVLANITRKGSEDKYDEWLKVTLDEYKGHPYIQLRVWFRGKEGTACPSKKGLTVKPREITEVIEALQKAKAALDGGPGQDEDFP